MSAKRKLKPTRELGKTTPRLRRPKEISGPAPLRIPRAPRQVLGARLKSRIQPRRRSRISAISTTRSTALRASE